MTALIPPEFLFRYTFPVPKVTGLPRRGKRLLKLPDDCIVASLGDLRQGPSFSELRLAWNDNGLAVSLIVKGKKGLPKCDPERLGETDGLRFWIDTRDTQSIHRASRFCHQFEMLPSGGGEDGKQPVVTQWPIARAKEEAPIADSDLLPVQSIMTKTGYTLEAWLPADSLQGFDPVGQPRLGFFFAITDRELGLQTCSVGAEFPFSNDPSLWSTLQLMDSVDESPLKK